MTLYHLPVRLTFNGGGSPGVNIWDIRTTGTEPGSTDVDLDEASQAIEDFYGVLFAGDIFPGGYRADFDGVATTIEANPQFVTSAPWANATGSSFASAPTSTQMIATLRTSSASRRGRGRKFIGPVGVSTVGTQGTPTPGAVATLQNACNGLIAFNDNFANGAIGVYSQVDQVFRDATSMQARNYFAVLRSRRD